MRILKIEKDYEIQYEPHRITNEELQREYNYLLAYQITNKMLEAGLITQVEYKKIRRHNIQTFKPFLYQLMLDE